MGTFTNHGIEKRRGAKGLAAEYDSCRPDHAGVGRSWWVGCKKLLTGKGKAIGAKEPTFSRQG